MTNGGFLRRFAMTTKKVPIPPWQDGCHSKIERLETPWYGPLVTCDYLAAELPTEPQSTALSGTATKEATHPTMTWQTVERDQRRTTCDHLAVTKDHLTTDETLHQDKKTAGILGIHLRIMCLMPSMWKVQSDKMVKCSWDDCPQPILFIGRQLNS